VKRTLAALVILPLCVACKKSPGAAPAAASPASPASSASAPAPPAQPGQAATPAQAAAVKPLPAQLPEVVARVNGEAISRTELENAIRSVEARAGRSVPDEQRAEVTRQILDQIVDYHVLAAEAGARKLAVPDGEVKARIDQMKQGFGNEQAFQQALAQQHVTLDELTKQARTGMVIDKLVETEITPKIAVQDADINTFYQQNLERFKQGESVHASHILIAVPQGATPAQKAEAKAKAEQVLKQVRAGTDFAKLAREQSQDPGSAPNGGDLGFFPKGQMEPHFEAVAFGLKPGAVSDIVETPFGFHIIKLIERKPAHTAALADVSDQIRQFLTEQQREERIQQFVATAKSKAKIEILI
jgi:peptidyl-prolyl cis-trans isomerase C